MGQRHAPEGQVNRIVQKGFLGVHVGQVRDRVTGQAVHLHQADIVVAHPVVRDLAAHAFHQQGVDRPALQPQQAAKVELRLQCQFMHIVHAT
ncbi:hypothetical protein AA0616_2061 [Komagataeibacter nataicola NRIC 0616]|nr:hypothetical protein AA0616_2061 [Komagataeibacter nataicola NRIC 0616]